MALEITGNIETKNGIVLSSAYGRVITQLSVNGTRLYVTTEFFPNKDAYINNKMPIPMNNDMADFFFDYDRTTEGGDLLLISSEKVKEVYEGKGLSVLITEL